MEYQGINFWISQARQPDGLESSIQRYIEYLTNQPNDANALMDLSIGVELLGDLGLARQFRAEALLAQSSYTVAHTKPDLNELDWLLAFFCKKNEYFYFRGPRGLLLTDKDIGINGMFYEFLFQNGCLTYHYLHSSASAPDHQIEVNFFFLVIRAIDEHEGLLTYLVSQVQDAKGYVFNHPSNLLKLLPKNNQSYLSSLKDKSHFCLMKKLYPDGRSHTQFSVINGFELIVINGTPYIHRAYTDSSVDGILPLSPIDEEIFLSSTELKLTRDVRSKIKELYDVLNLDFFVLNCAFVDDEFFILDIGVMPEFVSSLDNDRPYYIEYHKKIKYAFNLMLLLKQFSFSSTLGEFETIV